MKQAFLIAYHQDPDQLMRLITALDSAKSVFYIHVDVKSKETFEVSNIYAELKKRDNVFIFSQYKIYWGGFSQVQGTLFLLRQAYMDKDIGYFHFLSGIDYPIKPISEIINFFENNDKDYLTFIPEEGSMTYLVDRYYFYDNKFIDKNHRNSKLINWFIREGLIFVQRVTWFLVEKCNIRIRKKIPLTYYHGSNWFDFSRNAVEYILHYIDNNKWILRRFKNTAVADESFFTMILCNNIERQKIIINDDLRLRLVNGDLNRSGYILTEEDFCRIRESNALFARKFATGGSDKVIELINHNILSL